MTSVLNYVRRYFKSILLLFIIIALQAAVIFIGPIIIRKLLDNAEIKNTENLIFLVGVYFGVLIISYLIRVFYDFVSVKLAITFKTLESKQLYKDLFQVDYGYIRTLEPTYFVTRIKQAVDNMHGLIGEKTPKAIISMVTLCLCLIFIANINIYMFLLFAILIPVNLLSYHGLNNYLKNASKKLQHVCADNFKDLINVVKNIEFIKLSNNYDHFVGIISQYVKSIEMENGQLQIRSSILSSLIDLVINLIKNGILILSIYFYILGTLSFSNVMFINLLLNIFYNALLDLKKVNLSLRDLRISEEFRRESIQNNKEINEGTILLDEIKDMDIRIKGFKYPEKEDTVLSHISLDLNAGDRISLVGKSGCGKSTITRLLTRLYEAKEININGIPIEDYDLKSLRDQIYLVTQNVYLFPGTIKDNIVINHKNYRDKRLADILKLGFLEDFRQLPKGFNTVIKEDGSNISGGQKQKIAIARMLMSDAQLIIFDEATSALDSNSESLIYEEIEPFLKDKTVIKISHRISTISKSHRIYVIKDGEIEGWGNNQQELLETSHEFKLLFQEQVG